MLLVVSKLFQSQLVTDSTALESRVSDVVQLLQLQYVVYFGSCLLETFFTRELGWQCL